MTVGTGISTVEDAYAGPTKACFRNALLIEKSVSGVTDILETATFDYNGQNHRNDVALR